MPKNEEVPMSGLSTPEGAPSAPEGSGRPAIADALAELQAVYDSVAVGLCVLDTDLRWVRINAKMAEINGSPAADHVGRSVRELLPRVADAIEPMLRGIIATGEPVLGIEVTGETPAQPGVKRVWLADYLPLRSAAGQVIAINIVAQEVTASRAAEEHRRRLVQLIEHSPDFIGLAGPDGRVIFLNRGGRRMIGADEDADLSTVHFSEYVAPASQQMFRDIVLPSTREHGGWEGEMQLRNMRTGRTIDVLRSTFSLRDQHGVLTGYATVTRDITAAKAATSALAEREALLRLFVERAPAAIAMFDLDMRYLAATRRYVEDFRLSSVADPQALIGRSHYELFPHIPQERHVLHRRALAGETLGHEGEMYVHPDGQADWFRWELAPWHRADGAIGGIILFTELMTARRQAELVLSRDRVELERLVAERTRDLQQTQARLAQAEKLAALGQLAGGIAHDFNNVLQSILGGADLIRQRSREPAAIAHLVGIIDKAATRGMSVTQRLLTFARGGDLRAEPIDPVALLRGMGELLGHTLGAAIDVRVQIEPRLPTLLADRGQLETVLINLATNARDAMPAGGTLTLDASRRIPLAASLPTEVRQFGLGDLKAEGYVRLAITDTGSGMTPEVLAHLTEPFFTTKPRGKGTGLGLAMARGFAEQSGGGLGIVSACGKGTTVELWLPAADGQRADATTDSEPVTANSGRKRILLVDDDELVRELVAEQLEMAGYAVLSVEGGGKALASLDAGEAVDLVLSDLSMPDMDGIALIQAARQRRPGLPAVLLTGFATSAIELAASRRGAAFSLLRKPVSARQLAQHVAARLEASATAGP
jgi:PAS domain S-box-containing protein